MRRPCPSRQWAKNIIQQVVSWMCKRCLTFSSSRASQSCKIRRCVQGFAMSNPGANSHCSDGSTFRSNGAWRSIRKPKTKDAQVVAAEVCSRRKRCDGKVAAATPRSAMGTSIGKLRDQPPPKSHWKRAQKHCSCQPQSACPSAVAMSAWYSACGERAVAPELHSLSNNGGSGSPDNRMSPEALPWRPDKCRLIANTKESASSAIDDLSGRLSRKTTLW
mmetsp:Transcript_71342/g.206528  ORF Transcript_71342/g.206528 Transcript_71342/m.206528 type:complete len:219 (+) Transcript_71342:257-913(+)